MTTGTGGRVGIYVTIGARTLITPMEREAAVRRHKQRSYY